LSFQGLDAFARRDDFFLLCFGGSIREEELRCRSGGIWNMELFFSPEALSAMGKAFEAAIWTLGPECDEMKREAVAKFIIRLAREDGNLGATTLHRRTVAAFGSPTVAVLINEPRHGRPPPPRAAYDRGTDVR
jgi:hypothetical protein